MFTYCFYKFHGLLFANNNKHTVSAVELFADQKPHSLNVTHSPFGSLVALDF